MKLDYTMTKSTAQIIDEKFDNGEDVLSYFDTSHYIDGQDFDDLLRRAPLLTEDDFFIELEKIKRSF